MKIDCVLAKHNLGASAWTAYSDAGVSGGTWLSNIDDMTYPSTGRDRRWILYDTLSGVTLRDRSRQRNLRNRVSLVRSEDGAKTHYSVISSMTEEQRQLCFNLLITPFHPNGVISKEEFLRKFPDIIEGDHLSSAFLQSVYEQKESKDLQSTLIVGHKFGFSLDQVGVLSDLLHEDWHVSHENIVDALDSLQTQDAIEALFYATQLMPEYRDYDESRSMAVKAIWALGRIPGDAAESKLRILARSENSFLKEAAIEQLLKRNSASI